MSDHNWRINYFWAARPPRHIGRRQAVRFICWNLFEKFLYSSLPGFVHFITNCYWCRWRIHWRKFWHHRGWYGIPKWICWVNWHISLGGITETNVEVTLWRLIIWLLRYSLLNYFYWIKLYECKKEPVYDKSYTTI